MPSTTLESNLAELGIEELAKQLANGEVTSRQATDAFIDRIEQVDSRLRAVPVPFFSQARSDANQADEVLQACRAAGTQPPILCGVPITVKECFDVIGSAATLGIDQRRKTLATEDAVLVARLRAAGAVVLGKTNVPQAMLLHCCDNPVFGRTLHPFNPARGPGGSSGGEAAIVAAGGSPIGLGSDLGGSIRQPAHACGLVGFKPTSGRLTNTGSHRGLRGMDAITIDSGPLARSVADADLMMQALVPGDGSPTLPDEINCDWRDYHAVDVSQLNIAVASTDQWFAPSPPCERAVHEAAATLEPVAGNVAHVSLNDTDHAMQIYMGLVAADGFRSIRRMLRGSRVDWQIRRQSWFAGMPNPLRATLAIGLQLFGQQWLSKLLRMTGPRSADSYWQLTSLAKQYAIDFWQHLDVQLGRHVDAIVLPPHALPAMPHGTALDLLPAASYCYLGNLLGAPAGVVPWTTVRDDEQHYATGSRFDLVMHRARQTMQQSVGLPIGVQVIARPWQDDVALAVMAAIESNMG